MLFLLASVLFGVATASLSNLPQIRWADSNPMIVTEEIDYSDGTAVFRGFTARNILYTNLRPVVIVVPGKDGRNNFTDEKAVQLAELGYLGFVADIFGNDTLGYSSPPARYVYEYDFLKNRTKLVKRMRAALDTAKTLDYADPYKVAAIGYDFGGVAALELGKSGGGANGVVCFHCDLTPAVDDLPKPIVSAKILAQIGFDDYTTSPDVVKKFEEDMKVRGADWHLVTFGNARHSFAIPGEQTYNKKADKRSWKIMKNFFDEIFDVEHDTIKLQPAKHE